MRIPSEQASVPPANVPKDAIKNDPSKAPHCFNALPRKLVPSNNNGVAKVSETPCRNVLAGEPPGGSNVLQLQVFDALHNVGIQPTLDSTNVSAMAVTGAPRSLPTSVVLPSS